ncbi:MAG: hypothetical protein KC635_27035, partial [Myxococcales bacterium]|nr:hypothetical protein [Myxococcales bacterium]
DDGNPCTDDACDPVSGVYHTVNNAPCSDANVCTTGDFCAGGTCQAGTAVPIDDGNPCTDDACDPVLGVTHTNNTAPCSDGDVCNGEEVCAGGACQAGTPLALDDGNPCTNDACDPVTGVSHTNNSASCSDGNACNGVEFCAGGACLPGIPLVVDDGNPCTNDGCDPLTGVVHTNNSLPCSDGDACTDGDFCAGGACRAGATVPVDDGNPCTDDLCDPVAGVKHLPNGASCSDGNVCNGVEMCTGGVCRPGVPLVVDDGNPCTNDGCNPVTGVAHTNNHDPCDDGSVCTVGDVCAGGTCRAGAAVATDDGNPCTDDACDPILGVSHTNNAAPCEAGNPCLVGDTCGGGTCHEGTAPKTCDDGDGCTLDSCDPAVAGGCVAAPDPAVCDDGSACTTDTCVNTPSCADGSAPVGGLCIRALALAEPSEWSVGRAACGNEGAALVTIRDSSANAAVRAAASVTCGADEAAFIGLSYTSADADGAREYVWEDGTPAADLNLDDHGARHSSSFEYRYEMDSEPGQLDLDGSGRADFYYGTSSTRPNLSDGIATGARNDYYRSYGSREIWLSRFDSVSPFSIEVRVRIDESDGSDGAFGIEAAHVVGWVERGVRLTIGDDGVLWNSSTADETVLGPPADNTSDYHTFRLGRDDDGAYWVWRDGVLLNPDGVGLSAGDYVTSSAGLRVGATMQGDVDGAWSLDYLRLSRSFSAPGIPEGHGWMLPSGAWDAGDDALSCVVCEEAPARPVTCRNRLPAPGTPGLATEICNGVDDDCDGAIDEGVAAAGRCDDGDACTDDVCQASGVAKQEVGPTASDVDTAAPTVVTFEAPDQGVITDLDVFVSINGTYAREVAVTLSHYGKTVLLHRGISNDPAVVGSSYRVRGTIAATFDDEADQDVSVPPDVRASTQTLNLSGSYRPQGGSLAAFDGLELSGPWTLTIQDSGPYSGQLNDLIGFRLEATVLAASCQHTETATSCAGSGLLPVENPTNGHWYAVIAGSYPSWDAARTAAAALSHNGFAGHLATITSAEESAWIGANLGFGRYWIGGYQDLAAPDYEEPGRGWRWVTGEPFGYTNYGAGEPDDSRAVAGQNKLAVGSDGKWGDTRDPWDFAPANQGFIVEFGTAVGQDACRDTPTGPRCDDGDRCTYDTCTLAPSCPGGNAPVGGECLRAYAPRDPVSWSAARAVCGADGAGDLVTIADAAANDVVRAAASAACGAGADA